MDWVDSRGNLKPVWNNSYIKNVVISMENELPNRLISLVLQMTLTILVNLFALGIVPLLLNIPRRLGLFLVGICFSGAIVAVLDFAFFLFWGTYRKRIQDALKVIREKDHVDFLSNLRNMPPETSDAIQWALTQKGYGGNFIIVDSHHDLVDKVREYFNNHDIKYGTFSYDDLYPYIDKH